MLIINKIRSIFNPEQFQGWGQKRKYFEGWCYKIVNREETKIFAFIPGIAMDEAGKKHAFFQVLDGKNKTSDYLRFDGSEFIPKAAALIYPLVKATSRSIMSI